MSVGALRSANWGKAVGAADTRQEVETFRATDRWNPEDFAREQIRGLVRQLFFANATHPSRQVVFSPADSGTDVGSICRRVGEALASDTDDSIVVVLSGFQQDGNPHPIESATEPAARQEWLRAATRVRGNLWFVPGAKIVGSPVAGTSLTGTSLMGTSMHARLWELRREFAYSIIEAPPAGESSEAAALGRLADGIILVLSAHATRRATARKIKESLDAAQARLLGTVLSDRTFPIPESIYRRL